jgi:mevalonate kinase
MAGGAEGLQQIGDALCISPFLWYTDFDSLKGMPFMTVAYAPGKIILFGEHAVVYGRPAIAVPVTQVQAQVTVGHGDEGQGIVIVARDLGNTFTMGRGEAKETTIPLQTMVATTLEYLGLGLERDLRITIQSTIPIAQGLGSGAAVSTAMTRALAGYFSRELTAEEVSGLVYEAEKLYHGTPSGIDNTVIAHQRPVYFTREHKLETFQVGKPLLFVIADTGVESPTKMVVAAVRQAWEESRDRYEALFDSVGDVAVRARGAIEEGDVDEVGRLMDENHRLLQMMGVSSPLLDALVEAAKRNGALGAKLSGAGRGGNVIGLVTPQTCEQVKDALENEGAQGVIQTEVQATMA